MNLVDPDLGVGDRDARCTPTGCISPTKDHADPLGMIDERVPVALQEEHDGVAATFKVVHGVLLMPFKQDGKQPHERDATLFPNIPRRDFADIEGKLEIGLEVTVRVSATLVPDVHVEHRTGNVATTANPRLPHVGERVVGTVRLVGQSAAATHVFKRRLAYVGVGIGLAVRLVAA